MYCGERDDRRLKAAIRGDGGLDEGFAVVGCDDVVDVDVVVELVDLDAMRPSVELRLGTDKGSDGEGAVGLESFVEGVDEFGALLYFLSCAGGEVRVGIAVDAEADTDVGVAFLRFCGK